MRVAWPFAAAALIVAAVGVVAGLAAGSAETMPMVSPDRIDDAPSAGKGSFALIDNFAWRAFIALNWPSLPDAAHRGIPDRTKSLGDEGKRVWETFKSDYELFPIGDDGRARPRPGRATRAAIPAATGSTIGIRRSPRSSPSPTSTSRASPSAYRPIRSSA